MFEHSVYFTKLTCIKEAIQNAMTEYTQVAGKVSETRAQDMIDVMVIIERENHNLVGIILAIQEKLKKFSRGLLGRSRLANYIQVVLDKEDYKLTTIALDLLQLLYELNDKNQALTEQLLEGLKTPEISSNVATPKPEDSPQASPRLRRIENPSEIECEEKYSQPQAKRSLKSSSTLARLYASVSLLRRSNTPVMEEAVALECIKDEAPNSVSPVAS